MTTEMILYPFMKSKFSSVNYLHQNLQIVIDHISLSTSCSEYTLNSDNKKHFFLTFEYIIIDEYGIDFRNALFFHSYR